MHEVVYKVAIASPFKDLFDYYPPVGMSKILSGMRVKVPFGKRELIGIVINKGRAEIELDKIKRIFDTYKKNLKENYYLDAKQNGGFHEKKSSGFRRWNRFIHPASRFKRISRGFNCHCVGL